ncbi:hypothetical protein PG999_007656 [Apiospora kogelbergensis]|uniref:Uncharacterized protein n=1 Tax=Apiospora kogelbergensis TaxID=1337665 RepID=A0AAW0QMX2_9PEZI
MWKLHDPGPGRERRTSSPDATPLSGPTTRKKERLTSESAITLATYRSVLALPLKSRRLVHAPWLLEPSPN